MAMIEIEHSPGSEADAKQLLRTIEERQFDSVVLDGYLFGFDYQQLLHREEHTLLVVDDFQYCDRWSTDLVLNQNLHATSSHYAGATKHLLGPDFAMLRKEVVEFPDSGDDSNRDVCNVLLTLGGSNTDELRSKLLAALVLVDSNLNIRVLSGSLSTSQQHDFSQYRHPVTVVSFVGNMAEQYVWADVVVSAAGSSCWEWLYFQRIGAVAPIATNQVAIAESLQEKGLAVNLGWHKSLDVTLVGEQLDKLVRSQNRHNVQSVVDGKGASRVVKAILAFNAGQRDLPCCQ